MAESYRVAKKIAFVLGDDRLVSVMDYNLSSTYLELGETERAYALLQTVSRRDALYYHKLAIALEKLGRREDALVAVARGRAALQEDSYRPDAEEKMLALVEYRLLHPGDGKHYFVLFTLINLIFLFLLSCFARFFLLR